jgi:hypothetical protein
MFNLYMSSMYSMYRAIFFPSCFIPCDAVAAVISAEPHQAVCSTSELIAPLSVVIQACLCGNLLGPLYWTIRKTLLDQH